MDTLLTVETPKDPKLPQERTWLLMNSSSVEYVWPVSLDSFSTERAAAIENGTSAAVWFGLFPPGESQYTVGSRYINVTTVPSRTKATTMGSCTSVPTAASSPSPAGAAALTGSNSGPTDSSPNSSGTGSPPSGLFNGAVIGGVLGSSLGGLLS
ncbi:hypothetical protein QQS21_002284 [Conoideocrella luteorostrata]|uniref:Uncharacterized protein n=1 Tax=Conoideocrella luteorostrata TaxID=1105319 RepID=A0AAJ0CVG9_9HYPO|nr:hypothetical protein QQS21_002284 [Conoideocrella luteorostrata]